MALQVIGLKPQFIVYDVWENYFQAPFGTNSSGAILCLSLISSKNHVFPPSTVVALVALALMTLVGRKPHFGSAFSSTMVVFLYAFGGLALIE
jgi:hypothetical protein